MKLIDKIRVELFGWHHWKVDLSYQSRFAPFTLTQKMTNHRAVKKEFCYIPLHKMKIVNKVLLDSSKLTVSNVQYLGRW